MVTGRRLKEGLELPMSVRYRRAESEQDGGNHLCGELQSSKTKSVRMAVGRRRLFALGGRCGAGSKATC